MRYGKFYFAILLIVISIASPQLFAAGSLKALILSGQNNHDWSKTTPVLKQILADSDIDSEITENPAEMTAEMLFAYDVIVSNYNTFAAQNTAWSDATKKAFLDFISKGNGHVVVHAGGCSFQNWPQYQQIAAWWGPKTGHGQQHAFTINIVELDHPICSGIYSLWTKDELWHRTAFPENSQTLITGFSAADSGGSGNFEPILTVSEFGSGRCVNLMLGHDVAAMQRAAFKLLFTRSVQWAAGQKDLAPVPDYLPRNSLALGADDLTIDKAVENCKSYKYGQDRDHLIILQAKINSIAVDTDASARSAEKIAEILNSNASNVCKAFLCQMLGQIGTDKQIPSIANLLARPALSMHAVETLKQINTPDARLAIQTALKTASDVLAPAMLNALGDLRQTESINLIKPYLDSDDPLVRSSAVYALSRIGNKKACDILLKLRNSKSFKKDFFLSEAIIHCGYTLFRDGDTKRAQKAFNSLLGDNNPDDIRKAAYIGYYKTLGKATSQAILKAIASDDSIKRWAAIEVIKTADDKKMIAQLADKLDSFPVELQLQIISIVTESNTTSARPAIIKAVDHSNRQIRIAAIKAIGVIGDASSIDFLMSKLNTASREFETAIQSALVSLPASDAIENRIVEILYSAKGLVLTEMIKVVQNRRMHRTIPILFELATKKNSNHADDAVSALGKLAAPDSCSQIIELMNDKNIRLKSSTAAKALVTICRKIKTDQAAPIIASFKTANLETRTVLFSVLAALSGEQALDLVASYTTSEDAMAKKAALGALYKWKDVSALNILIPIAASSDDQQVIPALRAVMRLFSAAGPEQVRQYQDKFVVIMRSLQTVQGQKILLSFASKFPSDETFAWTLDRIEQPELANDAAAAALEIMRVNTAIDTKARLEILDDILSKELSGAITAEATRQVFLIKASTNLAIAGVADSPDGFEKDGDASGDAAAIDGDTNTYWDEQNGQKLYHLRITLPGPKTIQAIKITGYAHHNFAPKDFTVLLDGKTIETITNAEYTDNNLLVMLPRTSGSVVELKITGYYGQSPAIRELAIYPPLGDEAKDNFSLQKTDTSIALMNNWITVWKFNYSPDQPKPYFHPIALTDGTVLTWNSPSDHIWHHALWFSWKFINGINYWEPADAAKGTYAGLTKWSNVTVDQNDDNSAKIAMDIQYQPADQPAVLKEQRTVIISPPDDTGTYTMEWTSNFTALAETVILDRTPIPGQPNGVAWGGYAGLSVRIAQNAGDAKYITSTGPVKLTDGLFRGREYLMEYAATIGGTDFSISILDTKTNVNSPTPWYLINNASMDYFSPAVLCNEPMTFSDGDKFTLRYKIIISPRHLTPEYLKRANDLFNKNEK